MLRDGRFTHCTAVLQQREGDLVKQLAVRDSNRRPLICDRVFVITLFKQNTIILPPVVFTFRFAKCMIKITDNYTKSFIISFIVM